MNMAQLLAHQRAKVGLGPPKPRAPRGTGPKSRAKAKRLAAIVGADGVAFLASLEGKWLLRWRDLGGPEPVRQYVFAPPRRYRFDFAWPDVKCAVEVDGGTWRVGGHSTGAGHRRDREKGNLAASLGWAVFRFTADMVREGSGFAGLLEYVRGRIGNQ